MLSLAAGGASSTTLFAPNSQLAHSLLFIAPSPSLCLASPPSSMGFQVSSVMAASCAAADAWNRKQVA